MKSLAGRVRAPVRLAIACTLLGACDSSPVESDPEYLWQVPSNSASTAPLILDAQVIVAGLTGTVRSLDRETGATRWTRQLASGEVLGREVHEAAGYVLVPQYELWALSAQNGAVAWRFGGPDGAAGTVDVAVSGDTVFTGSLLGTVSAVDARTGTPFWSTDLGEAVFRPAVSDSLVLYGTRGYFGSGPREGPLGAGHLVALRRSDGSEAWRFSLPDSAGFPLSGGAVSAGVIVNDRVIIGGLSARVYGLSLNDGSVIWERANGLSPPVASYRLEAAILDGIVVLPRDDNAFEARDVETGELVWSLDRPSTVTRPRVVGGSLYLIDGPITMVDARGTVRWRFGGLSASGTGRSYYRGAVATDGTIYTLCASHVIAGGAVEICAIRPPVQP